MFSFIIVNDNNWQFVCFVPSLQPPVQSVRYRFHNSDTIISYYCETTIFYTTLHRDKKKKKKQRTTRHDVRRQTAC